MNEWYTRPSIITIPEQFLSGKRLLIISDAHGHYTEFISLLDKCAFEPSSPTEILAFLGDFMDRGKEEESLFQELLRLKKIMGDRLIWLWGNHEHDALERYYFFPKELNCSKTRIVKQMMRLHLPHVVKIGSSIVLTHAAYEESEKEDVYYYLYNRSVHLGREKIAEQTDRLIITGHTPVSYVNMILGINNPKTLPLYFNPIDGTVRCINEGDPVPLNGLIDIDTGAGNKEYLSCLIIQNENGKMIIKQEKIMKP